MDRKTFFLTFPSHLHASKPVQLRAWDILTELFLKEAGDALRTCVEESGLVASLLLERRSSGQWLHPVPYKYIEPTTNSPQEANEETKISTALPLLFSNFSRCWRFCHP